MLFLIFLFILASYGEDVISIWGGGERGWEGWVSEGSFSLTNRSRPSNPFPSLPHFESSETETAVLHYGVKTRSLQRQGLDWLEGIMKEAV